MIRHIVWWTLKPEAEGRSATENAKRIKESLENLRGQIAELKSIEVSVDILPSTTVPLQVVLNSTHDDPAGLKAYAEHPKHQAVLPLIRAATESRQAIDYIF